MKNALHFFTAIITTGHMAFLHENNHIIAIKGNGHTIEITILKNVDKCPMLWSDTIIKKNFN